MGEVVELAEQWHGQLFERRRQALIWHLNRVNQQACVLFPAECHEFFTELIPETPVLHCASRKEDGMLKKGEPVILRLKSEDVTHGFFMRQLKIDKTVEPGKP